MTDTIDLSAKMVEGIDKFLTRRTADAKANRSGQWTYSFTSPDVFEFSTSKQRKLLMLRLGVTENRPPPKVEILTEHTFKKFSVEHNGIVIYAVRWKVFEDLWAEGLLVQPQKNISARLVMISDADILPETLAGFSDHRGDTWGTALRMAQAGCQVLLPVMVSRADDYSGSDSLRRFTNQPHREWIYREAYELGRHVIGYELQKIFSAIDWFQDENSRTGRKISIGVAGYGEGGLLALYAAAIDRRINATLVSGYFNERENTYEEPIYRSVFGLLNTFGDAELAVMAWPAKLLIEYSTPPLVNGPPAVREGRRGAAPGVLNTISRTAAFREWNTAVSIVPECENHLFWIEGTHGKPQRPFSDSALSLLALQLKLITPVINLSGKEGVKTARWVNIQERQRRTVKDIEKLIQKTLMDCARTRDRDFWQTLENKDSVVLVNIKDVQRQRLAEVLGTIDDPVSVSLPFARKMEESALWTKYEVKLDVFNDVFAWGILMVPKKMRQGEKRPVVVCQHGLEGLPYDVVTVDTTADNYQYYKGFATRLAEKGYITFAPHNPYRGGDKFRVLQRKANPIGLSIFSVIVAQHRRILNWLSSLSFVDENRIGFYGLSYGGKTAMRVPALLTEYALSICSGDFNEWVLKNATTKESFSYLFTNEYEMPEWDLGHTFNYAEMAALIAPRPFMVERGIKDGVAVDEWVDFEFAKVRRHFFKIRLPERCMIEHFDGPHTINGKGTFEFLDKHLFKDWTME